jgi:Domain of unknown function (DUF1905)
MISLTGPLRMWTGANGSSHFLSIPAELSDEIRAHSLMIRRGFGSVRVEASVAEVTWRTSVFPSRGGGYFLPVKIEILRKTGIQTGDEVTITIDLL